MAMDEASGRSNYELAGVLMLDGVSFTDPVPILRAIPEDIPVYNLSATPYLWNLFGAMDAALATVRGDDFHGAQLLGGLHSDSMVGGNPLIQFGAYLLTGFSLPSNVEGSQILAAGWINDMFACADDPHCETRPRPLRRPRRDDHHPDEVRHRPRVGSAEAGRPRHPCP